MRRMLRFAPILSILAAAMLLAAGTAQAALTLLDTIRLNDPRNGHQPWGIACGPAGDNRVYVACLYGPGHLMVLDAAADTVLARGALTGPYPHGIEINQAGDRAYVSSTGGTVSIVDAQTLEELHAVPLSGVLMDLCLYEPAAGASKLYVVDMNGARVRVLDATDGHWMHDIPVGNYPYDVCAIPATQRVYVANLSDGTVSVINAAVDQVVTTIAVGAFPEGIAADPVLNRIYAANRDDNTVSVVNGATNQVIATYPVGAGPVKVAVDPTTHLVYVVNQTSQDVTMLSPDGPLGYAEPTGLTPRGGVCVDPGLGRVFVTNLLSDDVTAFSAAPPGRGKTTIRLRFDPGSVAVSRPVPGGPSEAPGLIVGDGWGNDADHLDLSEGARVHRYLPGYVPTDVDARLADGRAAVVVANADALYLLDDLSGAVTDTIPVGDEPKGLCIRDDINRAYVANWASNDLSVVDLDSARVIDTVAFTWGAMDVAVDEELNKIFVTTWWGLLWVIDGATHEILDEISLHGFCEMNQLAVDRVCHRVYVLGLNCPALWVVDGQTHKIGPILDLPGCGTGIAVNEQLQRVYVAAGSALLGIGPELEVIDTLAVPGSVVRCDVEWSSRQVLVSGADESGGVIYRVWDRDASTVMPGPQGDEASFTLSAVQPNPARGAMSLRIQGPRSRDARAEVFDVLGSRVRVLSPSESGGDAWFLWDGRLADRHPAPAGMYVLRVTDGRLQATRRVILMR